METTPWRTWGCALSNVTSGGSTLVLPGLDASLLRSAFYNQTIVFFGDSTLFYPTKWLYALMDRLSDPQQNTPEAELAVEQITAYSTNNDSILGIENMNLTAANHIVNPDTDNDSYLNGLPPQYIDHSTNTQIRWVGYHGSQQSSTESCDYPLPFQNIATDIKPDILVVNMGMHWLHFVGAGRPVDICKAHRWTYYERDFLEAAVGTAQKSKTKMLLFKTTNFICDDKYRNTYQLATQRYHNASVALASGGNSTLISNCIKLLQAKQRRQQQSSSYYYNLTVEQLETYCHHGVLMEAGASHLNQRLHAFVKSKQEQQQKKSLAQGTSGDNDMLQIALFNDHDVESCQYTGEEDGRHYHPLNLLRIRMLANMITCLRNPS